VEKRQITSHILMVRPYQFGFNEETAADNAFQKNDQSLSEEKVQEKALAEFDALVEKLMSVGVDVTVVEDLEEPYTPDAIFPNNWITFHQRGMVATYPMFSNIRRQERREDIVNMVSGQFGFRDRIHFEHLEAKNAFLEGTGSLILDRLNKIAYACLSERTHKTGLKEFCKWMGYKEVSFTAVDGQGTRIYHTNVMMALGKDFAVICMDAIPNADERKKVEESLRQTDKDIIEITPEQMNAFAGNMLQVAAKDGQSYLVMSEQAKDSLSDEQVAQIEKHTRILSAPIPTIEAYGGGSVRCMMAEIFPPQ
jgi:hypothetical protein